MSEQKRNVPVALVKTAKEVAITERESNKKDILDARARLDEFTLRDFSDAVFGEDYSHIVYGAEGGSIKMGDLKFSMQGTAETGEASMKLDKEQMIAIILEGHPNLSRADALVMLTSPARTNQVALRYLSEQEDAIDDALEDAHKKARDAILGEAQQDFKRRDDK